mmetsp:Transcript_95959/g.249970  ORF Transcript_95959/g.249970 Transcript_95959/m.249970 type:complete len:238 (-) Transcript_95959:59-772(-)
MSLRNSCGPFRIAKELSIVIEPKANSRENFCGAIGSIGRKDSDIDIRNTPARNTPANWASFAGDIERAARPRTLLPAACSLLFAAPATLDARSLALAALEAPNSLARFAASRPLPCRSFALSTADLPFSASASRVSLALSARPLKVDEAPLVRSLACPPMSMPMSSADVFLYTLSVTFRVASVTSATCAFMRLATFAHEVEEDEAAGCPRGAVSLASLASESCGLPITVAPSSLSES